MYTKLLLASAFNHATQIGKVRELHKLCSEISALKRIQVNLMEIYAHNKSIQFGTPVLYEETLPDLFINLHFFVQQEYNS